jgi:hypothetical protein
MKKLLYIACLVPLVGCVGCVGMSVPKTTISGSINNVPFKIESPKDSKLTGLEIQSDANNSIHIHIDSLEANMNPDVITMSGKAQVDIINAVGGQVGTAMAAGAKAAATK